MATKKQTPAKKKTLPQLVPGTRYLPRGWEQSAQIQDFIVMGVWAKMKQWNCALCAWNTLDGELAILDHIRGHIPPVPQPSRHILIAKK